MKTIRISLTEAERNFTDCLNRVHYQNVTFVLMENGVAFARLEPDTEKVCYGRDLAKVLSKVTLGKEEARSLQRDMRSGHKILKAPSAK